MDLKHVSAEAAAKRRESHQHRKLRATEKLQDLLAKQQSRRDEQLRELLAKPQRPRDRAGKRRRPGPVVAAMRSEIQQAIKHREPAARCRALLQVEDRAARLDTTKIEQQDRMWHADSLRLMEDGFIAAARQLGGKAPVALRAIRAALPDLRRLTAGLTGLNEAFRSGEPSEDQVEEWFETVGALNQQISHCESTADEIRGLPLDEIPLGRAIAAAREAAQANVSGELFGFKCLVMVAKADGKITEAEMSLLEDWGRRLWLSADEAAALIKETRSVKRGSFQGGPAAAESLVQKMCECVALGGKVGPREEALVVKLGDAIGVGGDRVNAIMAETAGTDKAPAPR